MDIDGKPAIGLAIWAAEVIHMDDILLNVFIHPFLMLSYGHQPEYSTMISLSSWEEEVVILNVFIRISTKNCLL